MGESRTLNPITWIRRRRAARALRKNQELYGADRPELDVDLSFTEAALRFSTRNDLHVYMHQYFFTRLPAQLRAHRKYFERRGYGEVAYHSMWYLIFREYRPEKLLEIGVFRGQVISLWALIARMIDAPVSIRCISPFSAAGDTVSEYPDLDYLDDVFANFRHFSLPPPDCLRAFSTDPPAIAYLQREPLDCVYIDGGHDYDVVLSDYRNSLEVLKPGGLLVLDDSSLYTDFTPPRFSFAGHPGPSRVARDLADRELVHLGGVGHQNVYRKP